MASSKTLQSIEILSGRFSKKPPTGWVGFLENLPIKIIGIGVHGKFLYWICENETFIYSTLGMTGIWGSKDKHSRIKFSFSDGLDIFYNDQRNFGTIKIASGKHDLINKLKSLGPDPLQIDISNSEFIKCMRKKNKWGITKALMDQKTIAGIGNYIKSECLWLARISPHRKVEELSDEELSRTNQSIKQVVKESYKTGGRYTTTDKSKFFVYSKKQDPDGNLVKKETTDDKRATYWVPKLQR